MVAIQTNDDTGIAMCRSSTVKRKNKDEPIFEAIVFKRLYN